MSLHQTILSEIQQHVVTGRWPPGHRIPSEIKLAEHYGCSRMTINKVLAQLARTGLIERRRKAGSFVLAPQSRLAVMQIEEIRAEVLAQGFPYSFDLLARQARRSRSADLERLVMDKAGPLLSLTCLHHAGSQPFCTEERLINLKAAPAAADADFSQTPPGSWLAERVPWTSGEHRIRAEPADAATAKALRVRKATACLVVERRTWNSDQPVTWVRLTYPGKDHEVTAHFSPSHR